jgi:hypothetical protein
MPLRIFAHLRANVVAYLALFVALGGSSYAAVRLTPGSVTSRALAKRAVTHVKLAPNSVDSSNVVKGSLTSADFKPGAVLQGLKGDTGAKGDGGGSGLSGVTGLKGDAGAAGAAGAQGPAGRDGSASVGMRAAAAGAVTAAHGAATPVPLAGASWTQSAGELDLIAGSATIRIPASCTGSFGNSLIVSVDGATQTFAVGPTAPASGTVTVPFVVGTLTEPAGDTPHAMTAQFANSCTKNGEDYSVTGVKLDILKFR